MNNTITGYTWDFPGGMTGLCIVAAFGLLLIVSSYSFTLKKLRLRWRIIFILLRTAAFAALLYCLCNPRIETRRRVNETRGRRIAVFTDESGSMQKQNYWKRSRLQDAIRFLDENSERNDPNYEYSFFRFSDTVRKIGNPAENATKKKASTHLFELIAAQTPHLEAEQFDGAVYLTDGIDTSGSADAENAFSALATSKMKHLFVPVTTALTAPPSLALRKIEAPTLAFDGTDIQFTIMVQRVNLLKSSDIRLNIFRNAEEKPIYEFKLPAGNGIQTIKQRLAVKGTGNDTYRAELLLNGKSVDAKTWFLKKEIRRGTTHILVYNGALEYGNRFLKNVFLDEPSTKLEIVFAKDVLAAKEGKRQIDFSSQTELGKYDVIVLFNLNRKQITQQMEKGLREYVSKGGGLFFITGNPMIAAEYVSSPIEKLLPVKFSKNYNKEKRYDVRTAAIVRLITARNRRPTDFDAALQRNSEMKYKTHPLNDFVLTETGRESPIFKLKLKNGKTRLLIPRFEDFAYVESAKPAANVLAYHPDKEKKRHILMAYQNFGQGRSMVLASDPLWRWRLKMPSSDNTFNLFWKNLFSWLALGRNNEASWLIPNHILSANHPVEFQLSTGSLDAEPQEIACCLAANGNRVRLPLVKKDGKLFASFKPEANLHTITAEYQGKTIASATFPVTAETKQNPEDTVLAPDLETLERFATLPNVELIPETEKLDIQKHFPLEHLNIVEDYTLPLWHRFAVFALIAFSFGLELLLRRFAEKLV